MIDSDQFNFLLFALIGAVAGVGLLLVKPAPDEPELLDRFWPGARIYRLRCVRVIFRFFYTWADHLCALSRRQFQPMAMTPNKT